MFCLCKVVKSIKERRYRSHKPKENGLNYANGLLKKKHSKIVVYSCVAGAYDNIVGCNIASSVESISFIMFSDNNRTKSKFWKIESSRHFSQKDPVLVNRYIKMHPIEIFSEKYDYAIYIDGNIRVLGDIAMVINTINDKTGISLHRHVLRDDLYLEAKACMKVGKGNYGKIKEQIKKYKREGMPKDFGLYECNMIVVDLHNKNAKKIMDVWWEEFLRSGSMRDQIALPYVIWKLGYKFDDVGSLGDNIYRDPLVKVEGHAGGKQ